MSAKKRIGSRFEMGAISDPDTFIGQGGMGTVLLGTDTFTGEKVAIKVLKPDVVSQNPELVERFKREGDALRQLNHPNIVKMLAAVEEGGTNYLVMEYVEGGSLRDLLEKQPRLSIQRVLYIALDLADALTRAHRLKILHRDIKPGNVLLAEDGTPRLTDFGMARFSDTPHMTQTGAIVGTLSYLSPEAFNESEIDERSDIWAFGVMLFEMLSGQRPFPDEQMGPLIHAIMTKQPPDLEVLRPDAPIGLIDLIYRMLKKDRHARIPSIRLIGAELEALIRGATTSMQYVVQSEDTTGRFETPTPMVASSSQIMPPNNLPAQPTAFVGRDEEVKELIKLLEDPSNRLITVLGSGGIGKTRLALAAAEKHLKLHPDGTYFIALAGLENTEYLPSTIADGINFSFSGAADPKTELASYLNEKDMLLVLDNFEHLIGGASLIADLMQAAPKVKILVTSRERLRLRGEQLFELQGMRLPKGKTTEALSAFPAMQLFAHVAHQVMPDFELSDDTAPHASRIIHLVQGTPLGIELAAGWLENLSVEEIADEIERSLDFLETDMRDVPERHRSMRAVFNYSWNLMSEEERASFVRLAVFRGGFEREAAQKIADASLKTLMNLANKSLIQREPSGRYYVNKLLRQYAEEEMTAEMHNEVCRAHALYYADFLEKLRPVFGTRNEPSAVDALETELENILVAWRWALEHGHWNEIDRVLHTMMMFYQSRSLLREGSAAFKELADNLEKKGQKNTALYWRARLREVWIGGRLGSYEEGFAISKNAYEYLSKHNLPVDSSYALSNMGYASMMRGRLDDAVELTQQAAELGQTVKDTDPAAYIFAMANLGYALYLRGDLQQAREIYETLNNSPDMDNYSTIGLAYGYNNLGEILRDLGQYEEAQRLFQEAFNIFEEFKDRRGMAFTLNNLGGANYVQGLYTEAIEMYRRGYELHREIGDRNGTGHSLAALGNAAYFNASYHEARKYYEESLKIRREIGDQRGIADSMNDLALVNATLGNKDLAERYLMDGIVIRREMKDKAGLGYTLAGAAQSMIMMDELDKAQPLLQEARQIGEDIGQPWIHIQVVSAEALYYFKRGDLETAYERCIQTISPYQYGAAEPIIVFALVVLADIAHLRGNPEWALELATFALKYPRSYIPYTEQRATALMNELTVELPQNVVQEVIERGNALTLETVVGQVMRQAN